MKNVLLLIFSLMPLLGFAQANKAGTCSPTKNGKICYAYNVEIKNASKTALFNTLNKWAIETYGRDVFLSNVSSNKTRSTLLISSRVELLLNDTEKTIVKYKMYISCFDNSYTVEIKDIVYQYDPEKDKRYKTYAAEEVILNEGKDNTVSIIKSPALFCNATSFFMQNLFEDVNDAAKKAR